MNALHARHVTGSAGLLHPRSSFSFSRARPSACIAPCSRTTPRPRPLSLRPPMRMAPPPPRASPPEVEEKPRAPSKAPGKDKPQPQPEQRPSPFLPGSEPPPPPGGLGGMSTVEVVLDKAANAASDIFRHLARQASAKPTSSPVDKMVRGAEGKFQLQRREGRPVVLVLGSGWAAHSCIKVIDTDLYDVVVVSPRNFFCFTPMLPSTAVGTVEFRSLLEPIRTSNEFVGYLEANCDQLDLQKKVATCTAVASYEGGYKPTFELPYDILVVAVGEQPATFSVPGVTEHCCFMKEITDTVSIRNRIGGCFELAALPGTTDADRRRLLHFVVVGGGPTGVEFAGTLSDYVRGDLRRKFPQLMPYVRVSLLQSAQGILTQFDSKLAKRALDNLSRTGVNVRTGVRVVEVKQTTVVLQDGEQLEYGLCVWSCGNAARPLVQSLVEQVPEQASYQRGSPTSNKLAVDRYLRVVGARDTLALGDCSLVVGDPLPSTAQLVAAAKARLPGGGSAATAPTEGAASGSSSSYDELDLTVSKPGARLQYCKRPFEFVSLGIMAYVGDDKALIQGEVADSSVNLYGGFAFLLWRSVYITKQVSFRNRVLILFDWIKAKVFGRDLSMF